MEFGGWEMPLAYPQGTLAEHRACREDSVAFDVSHLGTVRVDGPAAFDRLQAALSNDLRRVAPGRAQYTHLLDDADGSVVDDIIVWWLSENAFDVMPNASNTDRVVEAIGGEDTTATRSIIAVQGPHARTRLATVAPEAAAVPRFRVAPFVWDGVACTAAGTGYTGEDGVELAVPADGAGALWTAAAGRRDPSGRAGGAGHPPPRGGAATARPRARTGHHAAPGRTGLGDRMGQGPSSGAGKPSRPNATTACAAVWSGWRPLAVSLPAKGLPSSGTVGRWAR